MSNLLPNTFQCFNLYIDRALEHLTDSEVRVLWYATRHILGWQDRIKKKQGHISLTMFERGYITETGKRYGGCGLSRGAIITACNSLVEFKFLVRVGTPNEDGQEWELVTTDIQWGALEARTAGKQNKLKTKTIKATQARVNRRAGTSDVPDVGGTSHVTTPSTSHVTTPSTSDVPNQSHSSNPSSKPIARKRNTSSTNTTSPQEKSITPFIAMKNAIATAFGWEKPTGEEWGKIQKAAKSLISAEVTSDDLASLYLYCKGKLTDFGPTALPNHVSDWRKTRPTTVPAAQSTFDLSDWYIPELEPLK